VLLAVHAQEQTFFDRGDWFRKLGGRVMKLLCGIIVLTCVPLALARNDVAYPSEKVTEFLVEKLDVTTLPSGIRPKREKGKKTFGDYGYVTR
jgi:hypothetical protein